MMAEQDSEKSESKKVCAAGVMLWRSPDGSSFIVDNIQENAHYVSSQKLRPGDKIHEIIESTGETENAKTIPKDIEAYEGSRNGVVTYKGERKNGEEFEIQMIRQPYKLKNGQLYPSNRDEGIGVCNLLIGELSPDPSPMLASSRPTPVR